MIDDYYFVQYGMRLGPFTYEELIGLQLDIDTPILRPNTSTWADACDIPELYAYFEKRGIYFPAKSNLASFWSRLLAYIIDFILVEIPLLLLFYELALKGDIDYHSPMQMFMAVVAFHIVIIIYNTICEYSLMKGSIGKRICGLVVVDVDGGKIRLYSALKRNIFKVLSRVLFYLGFLRVLWDEHRQGWHDDFVGSYVVRRENKVHG
ncbi:RDD family protein [Mucilaginibacter sp. BJC16-A38]|uniref:RDD family protein n=1 Tax=Mucilaginibacter phenanthrenivorans TaxID=1234842 RepID=UPI002157FE1E|nr:RDD family protein [Mucilaginibacter phenanthrenivorans]MCR8558748.1 RDD family protein [Mucilaginibacter phenanthrenivorans]